MTPELISGAAERLSGHIRVTPLLNSPVIDRIAQRRVFVKAECLQHTGSFKYRGAKAAITRLQGSGWTGGILAYSSGNHAQGVARAAREAGMTAVIVMPSDAPQVKVAATKAYGAEVVLYDRVAQSREEIGLQLAKERGLHLVKPYDDPDVISGQATVGLEIAQQASDLGIENAEVTVCCGGGGLTSGVALALAEKQPDFIVRTVEPVGFDDVARSLAAGHIQKNERASGSICDAILTPAPGELTFPIIAEHCGKGLVVSDDDALHAMSLAAQHLKITLEPGGAVALAAALFKTDSFAADTVIAVASGGNVEKDVFLRALDTH
ncbi:threonine ammonia-lyase [Qingshengfaniella alkalisoli]|uniref:Threonine/serine dehydratase n=1 Tax=Qingshengfaniella alkalisoli TaxID=2599296 RepID=A0A5B8IQX7_9RHOB|nr:threonine/serine dehydratase [Qingshengfaniella alkalisoli]QDY68652.1 threonine/serine dehydratase [Qingshengfaniella alkalisoli]